MSDNIKIILFDRDGTIIKEPIDERVDSENKIELFPDSIAALAYLARHDFAVILITNQAGIAERRITLKDFERINNKILEIISPSGIHVLKTYVCPHTPEDNCDCRKPKPKMILDAVKEFNLDVNNTYIVGDRKSDIIAGISAGVKTILVKTNLADTIPNQAVYSTSNLLDAVKYVVDHS